MSGSGRQPPEANAGRGTKPSSRLGPLNDSYRQIRPIVSRHFLQPPTLKSVGLETGVLSGLMGEGGR